MADGKPTTEQIKEQGQALVDLTAKIKGAQDSYTGLIEKLQGTYTASNLLSKAMEASAQLFGDSAINVASLNERLVRSTSDTNALRGANASLLDDLFKLSEASKKYGISIQDNYRYVGQFSKENVKLLDVYKKNRVGLADFAGRMDALNVPLSTSTAMVGQLTSNLDMNVAQLDQSRRALVGFATQTGQSVRRVVEDYSKSIKSFMDFLDPKEMNRSFMQFQVMARRMGTEANTLYGLATKFDTIEQSQQMGARMNQIFSTLGIEFNALALQEMAPRQRIDYIATKTREALTKARGMGGREGRLLVRALGAAGLGDPAMVRALGAEGGGGRATAFERARGQVAAASRAEEASLAARLNFYNVEKAHIKFMTEARQRGFGLFQKISEMSLKAPDMVLAAVPAKLAALERARRKMEETEIPGSIRRQMEEQQLTNAKNIKKLGDLLNEMGKKITTGDGAITTQGTAAFVKAMEDKASNVGSMIAMAFKAALKE